MSVPQRFHGSTVRAAMTEARKVLGPDALLLDQRSVDGQAELLVLPADQSGPELTSAEVGADSRVGDRLAPPGNEIILSEPSHGSDARMLTDPPPVTDAVAQLAALAALRSIGFSEGLLHRLSDNALTARLALSELLGQGRYSAVDQLAGFVPVMGPPGAGLSKACLQLALEGAGAPPSSVRFFSPTPLALAEHERLLLGSELLDAQHEVVAASELERVVDQPQRDLSLFELSLSRFPSYASALERLRNRGLFKQMILVVPLHWQRAAVERLLAPLLEWIDAMPKEPVTVHLFLSGLDLGEDISNWVARGLENGWSLGFFSETPRLEADGELLGPGRLCRLLLEQIDRAAASTTVKQAQGAG